MESRNRLTRWQPSTNLPGNTLRLLPEDWAAELELTVTEPSASGRRCKLQFDEGLAVRPANKGLRAKLLELSNDAPCGAFKVEDSEWVECFHEKTCGAFRDFQIQHFAFITEVVVEVLSAAEPRLVEMDPSASEAK